jgi:hypothetical protein
MGRRPPTFRGGIISVTTYAKKKPHTSPIRKIPVQPVAVVVEEAPDPEFLLVEAAEPEKSYCNIQ